MNMGSKLKQDLLNLLNERQLFSTTRNVNNISRIRPIIKSNLNKNNKGNMSSSRVLAWRRMCCTRYWNLSDELIADLKKAINERNEQIISFLNHRVYIKKSSIRETIPKNKRINFSNDYVNKYRVVKKKKLSKWKKIGQSHYSILLEKAI